MQHGDGLTEALDEAPDDLWRERDLRHEHDRPETVPERLCDEAHVDLGLPRSGDPGEQSCLGALGPQRGAQIGKRGGLLRVRRRLLRRTRAERDVFGARRRGTAFASAQPSGGGGRQDERERARERGAVLLGDPLRQRQQLDRKGGLVPVERTQRCEQLLLGDLAAVGQRGHHAEDLAPSKGHDQHRAHRHLVAQLQRKPVVERPAQRAGRCHRLDLSDRGHLDSLSLRPDAPGWRRPPRGVC